MKWRNPKVWVSFLILIPFFATSIMFYFLNKQQGITHNFEIIPTFLELDFSMHYKYVWIIDIASALLFGLLLERRWVCKISASWGHYVQQELTIQDLFRLLIFTNVLYVVSVKKIV